LAVAGVPYATLLTVVMFVLAIAQLGPLPVLLPAAGWLFWSDELGWGVFLLVVSVLSSVLDTVLRPLLIRLGADLHLLLVFGGVVGGMLAFGLVGIFIGPVVLAVGYTLTAAWVRGDVLSADEAAEARIDDPSP
jgi:predicted PurR-regulated permease PerM